MKEDKSLARELLEDLKKQNKRLFIIWIITFFTLIAVSCYTIYLVSDIGTITDEYTQEVNDIDTIENSTISNGGANN